MRDLSDQLDVLEGSGPFLLAEEDLSAMPLFEPYSAPVMLELQRRGVEFVVDDEGQARQVGSDRFEPTRAEARLVMLMGDAALTVPDGAEQVAFVSDLSEEERAELAQLEERLARRLADEGIELNEDGRRELRSRRAAPRSGPTGAAHSTTLSPSCAADSWPAWSRRSARVGAGASGPISTATRTCGSAPTRGLWQCCSNRSRPATGDRGGPRMDMTLALVVPVFDESVGSPSSCPPCSLSADLPAGSELILVDDGSCDSTAAQVSALLAASDRALLLRRPHLGKGSAVAAGLAAANAPVAAFCDLDLSTPIPDLLRVCRAGARPGVLAIGSRDLAGSVVTHPETRSTRGARPSLQPFASSHRHAWGRRHSMRS